MLVMCSSMTESVSFMTGESALIVSFLIPVDAKAARKAVWEVGEGCALAALPGRACIAALVERRCCVGVLVTTSSMLCEVFGGPSLARRG
jgi:hypothetical protein